MATAAEPSTAQEWVQLEYSGLPEFHTRHIFTYLFSAALESDSKGKNAKKYANLDRQGYSIFKADCIQSIVVSRKGNQFFIKCVCLPEAESDLVYNLEMTRDDEGHVVNTSCDCPPGDKVDDTCKHISALCYTLEEHSKIDEMYQMSDYCGMTRLEGCICPHQCRLLQVEESESTEFELEEEYEQSMVYDPQLLATAGTYFSHPPPSKLKTR